MLPCMLAKNKEVVTKTMKDILSSKVVNECRNNYLLNSNSPIQHLIKMIVT